MPCVYQVSFFAKDHPTPTIKVNNYVFHQNFPQQNSQVLKLNVERGSKQFYSPDMESKYIVT
jgi:hypothetical protein